MRRRRGYHFVGFVLNGSITVGGALAPNVRDHLSRPGDLLAFTGTVLQIIGLVIGVIYGVAAILEAARSGRSMRALTRR